MKIFPPSSSSSSSSTTSVESNICNSKRATAGCIAGVIRRLLCYGSLPTYPSDQITDNSSALCESDQNHNQKTEPPPKAGLMARLMGLETMPVTSLDSYQNPQNSISRSRSMNSADYWQEIERMKSKHRRVKTSLSFREMPTFLEMESEKFFILSFENESERKELGSKARKSEANFGELKQRSGEREKNSEKTEKRNKEDQTRRKKVSSEKENLRRRDSDEQPSQLVGDKCKIKDSTNVLHSSMDHEEVGDGAKFRKKKKKNQSAVKKVAPDENESEDSSPVSVLQFDEFLVDLQFPKSDENLRWKNSNSRRKLSPELENYSHPYAHNTDASILDDREPENSKGKDLEAIKRDCQNQNNVDMWREICRLAEGELARSIWKYRDIEKLEEFEDIGADFGSQILDLLLNELVAQLVGPPNQNFVL